MSLCVPVLRVLGDYWWDFGSCRLELGEFHPEGSRGVLGWFLAGVNGQLLADSDGRGGLESPVSPWLRGSPGGCGSGEVAVLRWGCFPPADQERQGLD